MNLQQLSDPLPKPWLNISANSLTASTAVIENIDINALDVNTVDSETIKSNDLLLNQNAVVGVPDNGYSMVYADNLNRLKVASQLHATETIAYQSDLPALNEIISPDTFTRATCSDGDNFSVTLNGVPSLSIDDVKSRLVCANSSLNLASLSDGSSEDATTFLSASNVGNTSNMSVVVLPSTMAVYQDSGTKQRMTLDDTWCELKTKNYAYGIGGSGAQLVLYDSNGSCFMGAGDLNSPSITLNPLGLRLSSLNQTFQRIMDSSRTAEHIYSPYVLYQVYRDEIDTDNHYFRDATNTERMRINTQGVQINGAYRLPTADGSAQAVLKTNGAGQASWVTPSPSFSSYAKVIVTGTARQTLISGSILGSLTIPADAFELGSVWALRAFGTYNVAPAQTIILSVLLNGVAVAVTPALSIANSPSPWSSSWVFTVQTVGGAGVGKLASGSTNRLDSSVVCSNTVDNSNFNTTISNTLDFTSTLSLIGDTIACESVSFSRVV